MHWNVGSATNTVSYNGLFSFGANFPNGEALDLAEFSSFKIHDPNIRKTHVSNTSHKVYMYTWVSGLQ